MTRISLCLAAGLAAASATTAAAQYVGPAEPGDAATRDYALTSIADILADPEDGARVTVEGMLLRKIGDEMYFLSDGQAEINVEIDDDDFPDTPVSETTRVRIEGEVDTHLVRDTDIEAERVSVID